MTKEELLKAMEDLIFAARNTSEELSKDNADIINMEDILEIQALLEHWGHRVRLYSGTSSNTGKRYYYIDTIDGISYRGDSDAAARAVIRIINQNLDENGIVKINLDNSKKI